MDACRFDTFLSQIAQLSRHWCAQLLSVPFHGLATRYLPNYLGWRWAIDQERIRSPETLLKAAIGVFHS
jgi:hypothetical protein